MESTGLLINERNYFKAIYNAAGQAKKNIFMAGWQFNSDVRLLDNDAANGLVGDVRLLPYLNQLCEKTPDLHIYILAWDFVEFLAFKKEWYQPFIFSSPKTNRIKFLFDSRHAIGASHHQKMVVIDGSVAFVGGLDLCHHSVPFHDIQSAHTGSLVRDFGRTFQREWLRAGGGKLKLSSRETPSLFKIDYDTRLVADRVAICRTQARTLFPPQKSITEIRQLYVDAIRAADKMIYIENQYFASKAVFNALIERMNKKNRPRLQIVLILPRRMKTILEDLALGLTQVRMLRRLKNEGERTGHTVGVYCSSFKDKNGREIPKLIHSKLFSVDDRFLSVGSANLANRSMGPDTELNVAWESTSDEVLVQSIQQLRIDLLSEHTGVPKDWGKAHFAEPRHLVSVLDRIAASEGSALRHHPMTTRFHWINSFAAQRLSIDPEKPVIEEMVYQLMRSFVLFWRKSTFISRILGNVLYHRS